MSNSYIPSKTKSALWAKAGGRCEYRGCNEYLVGDLVAGKTYGIYGYIAHIVADISGGPRGDDKRSPELCRDLDNLMLMCARHHKLIDVEDVDGHPEDLLLTMKEEHEARIETNTGISAEYASHVIRFGASIGGHESLVSTQAIFAAMPPDRHPATRQTIDLEMLSQPFKDDEPEFWDLQRRNLDRLFSERVRGRIERQEIKHLSVFALGPQPLLFELGRLLYDIVPITVHQRLREPEGWNWQRDRDPLEFEVTPPPAGASGPVALKLAISAAVDDPRIRDVLGDEVAIWTITIPEPGNDVVRRPEDTGAFRTAMRKIYRDIQEKHGMDCVINVFPVMPASLAVEAGRVWMPKVNPALRLFDHIRDRGFVEAFTIGEVQG